MKYFGFCQPMSSKMLSHESFFFHPEPNKDDFFFFMGFQTSGRQRRRVSQPQRGMLTSESHFPKTSFNPGTMRLSGTRSWNQVQCQVKRQPPELLSVGVAG